VQLSRRGLHRGDCGVLGLVSLQAAARPSSARSIAGCHTDVTGNRRL